MGFVRTGRATAACLAAWAMLAWVCLVCFGLGYPGSARASIIPPMEVEILDAAERKQGLAKVYPNFIELHDRSGVLQGAIGLVMAEGRIQLFLIRSGDERKLIGWAENHRLYDAEDKLVGYYGWTAIWNYVYDPKMKKVGQAQCLTYQGVCAAGVAGYLLGLF